MFEVNRIESHHRYPLLPLLLVSGFSLGISVLKTSSASRDNLLEAILIARRTLFQLPSTIATARGTVSKSLEPPRFWIPLPSVPSESVASFSSSICICPANPALRSRSCFRFSNSAFFSLMRAKSIGDCPVELDRFPEVVDPCRKWEGRVREENAILVSRVWYRSPRVRSSCCTLYLRIGVISKNSWSSMQVGTR